MMSEVIEIGYYRDNVLLTYYAIDVLEKKSVKKQGLLKLLNSSLFVTLHTSSPRSLASLSGPTHVSLFLY